MFFFLSGALMAACFIAAMFFARYWVRTRDPFFAYFALAWLLFGAERAALAARDMPEEPMAGMYFLRLAGFLLIIVAILRKNRRGAKSQ